VLRYPIVGLRDSKQLSSRQRQRLAEIIYRSADSWGLGWVSPTEIDALGLTLSVRLAYLRALKHIRQPLDDIVIDGNFNFLHDIPSAHTVIGADRTVPSVSAASIIAKTARDTRMQRMAIRYPHYGFEHHVGYGTAAHLTALKKFGMCKLHRRSFQPMAHIIAHESL